MTARALYLIAYDVAHPRRLRLALHATRAYAFGGQKSVHECYLSTGERSNLLSYLARILHPQADRMLALRLDPRMRPRMLGIARPTSDAHFLIIS